VVRAARPGRGDYARLGQDATGPAATPQANQAGKAERVQAFGTISPHPGPLRAVRDVVADRPPRPGGRASSSEQATPPRIAPTIAAGR